MIRTALRWLAILLVVPLAIWGVASHFSAQAALDRDFEYSAAAAKLPAFSPDTGEGLVQIEANGMSFRARVAGFDGQPDKPAVMLLHGFPVTSAMYADLIPRLAAAGYRVLAPDQRGYSPGARPVGASEYSMDKLTADAMALAEAVGFEKFHLVGHDWGAVVGWSVVMNHPEQVISWSPLSIAHPSAFGDAIANDPEQRSRSRYMILFATPWLAETVFSKQDFRLMRAMYASMSSTQLNEYLAMLREPGALTASFNWYRAAAFTEVDSSDSTENAINTPTVFVWGNQDLAVARYGVDAQAKFMKGPYDIVELEAGHWLLRDDPRQTIAAITQHINTYTER